MRSRDALPRGRWSRILVGALIATSSVVLAVVSHTVAGGHQPGVLGMGLAVALAVPVCMTLMSRRHSLPRIALSVGVSQALLHLLFSLTAPSAGSTPVLADIGHQHGALGDLGLAAGSTEIVGAAVAHSPGAAMWVAHTITAFVTIAMIRWADLAVRALALLARPWTAARAILFMPPSACARSVAPLGAFVLDAARSRICVSALSLRGPPAFV